MWADDSNKRTVILSSWSVCLAVVCFLMMKLLLGLIALITNLSFFGRLSFTSSETSATQPGLMTVLMPSLGGLIVGLMARYGASEIRGDGIPELMESILTNEGRIRWRVAVFKPLSAAISIGTGWPFGAEGPVITWGASLGSVLGQLIDVTPVERTILLASGAAAGMTSIFGTPVAAILLVIELLLVEYRPRSLIPVGSAALVASALRQVAGEKGSIFQLHVPLDVKQIALLGYAAIGVVTGVMSVVIIRLVSWFEDRFERLPFHWMWWPTLAGLAVGVIGFFEPDTLGLGYDVIRNLISGRIPQQRAFAIAILKLLSWSIALASGMSGGILAPLFIVGGGMGYFLATLSQSLAPGLSLHPGIAALVGMSSIFAGASRAVLSSIIFALVGSGTLETLLPLLAAGVCAYGSSWYFLRESIITQKIVRRGIPISSELTRDYFEGVLVREFGIKRVVTLNGTDRLVEVKKWLSSGIPETTHQRFPVVDERGNLLGVVTRKDIFKGFYDDDTLVRELIKGPPIVVEANASLREAMDLMARHDVGGLPVVATKEGRQKLVGIITRSDLLAAQRRRLAYQFEIKSRRLRPATNLKQCAGDPL